MACSVDLFAFWIWSAHNLWVTNVWKSISWTVERSRNDWKSRKRRPSWRGSAWVLSGWARSHSSRWTKIDWKLILQERSRKLRNKFIGRRSFSKMFVGFRKSSWSIHFRRLFEINWRWTKIGFFFTQDCVARTLKFRSLPGLGSERFRFRISALKSSKKPCETLTKNCRLRREQSSNAVLSFHFLSFQCRSGDGGKFASARLRYRN